MRLAKGVPMGWLASLCDGRLRCALHRHVDGMIGVLSCDERSRRTLHRTRRRDGWRSRAMGGRASVRIEKVLSGFCETRWKTQG